MKKYQIVLMLIMTVMSLSGVVPNATHQYFNSPTVTEDLIGSNNLTQNSGSYPVIADTQNGVDCAYFNGHASGSGGNYSSPGGDGCYLWHSGLLIGGGTDSFDMWVKWEDFNQQEAGQVIVYERSTSWGLPQLYYRTQGDDADKLIFSCGSGDYYDFGFISNLNDNNWHHICITKTSTNMSMYIDGEYKGSNSHNDSGSASYTYFGCGRGRNNVWKGWMHNSRIWNGIELTAEQVMEVYQEKAGTMQGTGEIVGFSWEAGTPLDYPANVIATTEKDGDIYCFGGGPWSSGLSRCRKYNIESDTWTNISNSGFSSRYSATAINLNDELFVLAGYSGYSGMSSVQVYDTDTDSWSTRASLSNNCGEGKQVGLANGEIYAFGGHVNNNNFTQVMEKFTYGNPGSWNSTLTQIPLELHYGATIGFEEKLFVFGGQRSTNQYNHTLIYDTILDDWAYGTPIPLTNGLSSSAVTQIGEKLYLFGGYNALDGNQTAILEYDPQADTWTNAGDLPIALRGHKVIHYDGKVYVVGGYTDDYIDNVYIGTPIYSYLNAEFTASDTLITVDSEIQFADLSSGNPTSWEWDFQNDGIIDSNEQNPFYIYNVPGTYTVSLTISDETYSNTETKIDYITVNPYANPTIVIQPESLEFGNVCINESATIPITVYNYGQPDLIISNVVSSTDRFSVSFPTRDMTFTLSSMQSQVLNVSFSPNQNGEIQGNLIFFSNDSNNSMLMFPVNGTGYEFFADFTANPIIGDIPLEVDFTNNSVGDIQSYLWDFGDGETSTLEIPNHVYDTEGIYTVSLTIEDNYHQKNQTQVDLITAIAHPILFTPDSLGFDFGSLYLTDSSEDSLIIIQNIGTKAFQIDELSFVENTGSFNFNYQNIGIPILPNESDTIFVNFFPQNVGSFYDHILISNTSENHPNLEINLEGVCEFAPPKEPENVQLNIVDPDAIVTWDAVTENIFNFPLTPDGYAVYYSEISDSTEYFFYLAFTTETNYTHFRVGDFSSQMFYKVIAYVELTRTELEYLTNFNSSRRKMKMSEIKQHLKSLHK